MVAVQTNVHVHTSIWQNLYSWSGLVHKVLHNMYPIINVFIITLHTRVLHFVAQS